MFLETVLENIIRSSCLSEGTDIWQHHACPRALLENNMDHRACLKPPLENIRMLHACPKALLQNSREHCSLLMSLLEKSSESIC